MAQEYDPELLRAKMEAEGIIQHADYMLKSGAADTKVEFDVVNKCPELLEEVSACAAEVLRPFKLDALLSIPTGATPSGDLIAERLGIYHIPAKKTESGVGLQAPMVNGAILRPKERIGIWDDVLTTGNTIVQASNIPQIAGKVAVAAVAWDRREYHTDHILGTYFPVVSLVNKYVPFWSKAK